MKWRGKLVWVLVGLLALLAWLWFRPKPATPLQQAVAQVFQAQTSTQPVQQPAATPASPSARPPEPAASAVVWDLCGVGRMPAPAGAQALEDDGMEKLPRHLGVDLAIAAAESMAAKLDTADVRSRAALVVLVGTDGQGRDRQAALSALASSSSDPVVAMWAADLCFDPARCDPPALARWVEIEPENAAAWLLWLEAHPEQRSAALQRLASARRFVTHEDMLLATALQAMPGNVPAYIEPALWSRIMGVAAARPIVQMQRAASLCRPPLAAGSELMTACARLAEVLAEHSDSTLARLTGARIGESAGWPAERVQAVRDRSRAEQAEQMAGATLDAAQPLSCNSVESVRQHLQARARAALSVAAGAAPVRPPPAGQRP
jgi:hypothetical protein